MKKNQLRAAAAASRQCWSSSWTFIHSSHLRSQLQLQQPPASLHGVKSKVQRSVASRSMTSLTQQKKAGCGCLQQRRPFATRSSTNHRPSNLQRRNANAGKSRHSGGGGGVVGGGGGGKPTTASSSSPEEAATAKVQASINIPSHVYHQHVGTGQVLGPYGLRRIDYAAGQPPPKWPLPPHPPPHANPIRRYFPHFLIATAASLLAYVYVNREDEASVQKYWKAVEQGNAPISMAASDNDKDDEDDDEYDLDRDEWEDDNDKVENKK